MQFSLEWFVIKNEQIQAATDSGISLCLITESTASGLLGFVYKSKLSRLAAKLSCSFIFPKEKKYPLYFTHCVYG